MKRALLAAALAACTHSRVVEVDASQQSTKIERDAEHEKVTASAEKTVKVGASDTVTVEATFSAAADGGVPDEQPDHPFEVAVVQQADGGVSVRVVPPRGQRVVSARVTDAHRGPIEAVQKQQSEADKVKTREAEADAKSKVKGVEKVTDKIGLSLTTKLVIWGGVAAALAAAYLLARRAGRVAVAAIPVVGPLLALILPKEKTA